MTIRTAAIRPGPQLPRQSGPTRQPSQADFGPMRKHPHELTITSRALVFVRLLSQGLSGRFTIFNGRFVLEPVRVDPPEV